LATAYADPKRVYGISETGLAGRRLMRTPEGRGSIESEGHWKWAGRDQRLRFRKLQI